MGRSGRSRPAGSASVCGCYCMFTAADRRAHAASFQEDSKSIFSTAVFFRNRHGLHADRNSSIGKTDSLSRPSSLFICPGAWRNFNSHWSWLISQPKLHPVGNKVFFPAVDVWAVQLLLYSSGHAPSAFRSKLVPEAIDGLACSKRFRAADGNTIPCRTKIFCCLLH